MEQQLSELKMTFHKIIGVKNDNDKKMLKLESKTKHLKNIYNDFIKYNNEILCVFSLDSLHFQAKVIDVEYDDMKRLFSCILNRMYCEFFKLYKIITDYIKTSITDKKVKELLNIHNQYPVYKDLEPFKVYEFETIESIHAVVLELLVSLISLYLTKEDELTKYKNKNKVGFNIDNFVNTIVFNNTILREKIQLFINYLSFFHKLQIKYLSRYINKLDLVISQLDSDINFEERQDSSEEYDVIIEKEYTSEILIEKIKNVLCEDSGEKYEMPIYEAEYNSDMSSLDGTIEVVENSSETSNSKRKKYLAKKKRLQQKKLENKKVSDGLTEEEILQEENIELTVEESPSTEENNGDGL
jgi:hypothetical protein